MFCGIIRKNRISVTFCCCCFFLCIYRHAYGVFILKCAHFNNGKFVCSASFCSIDPCIWWVSFFLSVFTTFFQEKSSLSYYICYICFGKWFWTSWLSSFLLYFIFFCCWFFLLCCYIFYVLSILHLIFRFCMANMPLHAHTYTHRIHAIWSTQNGNLCSVIYFT